MALRCFKTKSGRFAQLAAGVCVALSALAILATPADARRWRHYRHYAVHRHYAPVAGPAFAAMVVDANSGRTLYAASENELRHPASITKVMTLYLLFEQLEKGALTLQSPITVSAHAASQAPSKLGLEPGQTIAVEDAIKAVVTRSANDVAVAIAEAVGEDEASFAQMMTRKAHALGMSRTNYRNASGLPDDAQVTTAHDLTILARAVQERFPRYFKYFSTHEFEYAGEVIGNHNHLLGRIDGVDGIKTGYTRASGFNLLTSVHRDGRSLVAVVMGGRTAGARDRMMAALIDQQIAKASNNGHTATMIAEAAPADRVQTALLETPRKPAGAPLQLAPAAPIPLRSTPVAFAAPLPPVRAQVAPVVDVAEGDDNALENEPPTPALAAVQRPIKSVAHLAGKPVTVAVLPPPAPARVAEKTPEDLGWVKGPDAAPLSAAKSTLPARPAALVAAPITHPKEETRVARTDDAHPDHTGWIIQIGATDNAGKATDLLIRARAQNRVALASATPFTEKVQKGEDTFYRARFAGLGSDAAESACKSLKKSGFSCFTAHD